MPQPCISLATFLERVLHFIDLQQLRTRGVSTAPRVWATKKSRWAAGGGRDPGSGVADVHMHAIAIHEDLQSGAAVALGYGPEVSRGGEGHGATNRRAGSWATAMEKTHESRSGIAGTGGEGRNWAEAWTDASGGHEASDDAGSHA